MAGLYVVQSCRIAVWNNIDITERHTILHDYSNTITLQESDRILLVRQANTEESGIYVVRSGYLKKSNDPHDNQEGTCTFTEESEESFVRHEGYWYVFSSPGVLYADGYLPSYIGKDTAASRIQKWWRKLYYCQKSKQTQIRGSTIKSLVRKSSRVVKRPRKLDDYELDIDVKRNRLI